MCRWNAIGQTMVQLKISSGDGVPIYRQVVSQIKYKVASGALAAGDELPPIRALAEQLLVTPNTIVKAYGVLENEGVVVKRQGSGTFVSEAASPLAKREQIKVLEQRADALLAEAQLLGCSYEDVLVLLKRRNELMNSREKS